MGAKRYDTKMWGSEEEEILNGLWHNKNINLLDIEKVLGRSRTSILHKARIMGYENRSRLENLWRLEEIRKRLKEVVDG